MSNIENDSDYEQVFIINETEDSFASQPTRSTINTSNNVNYEPSSIDKHIARSTFNGFAVFLGVFIAVVIAVFAIGSHFKLNSDAVGRASLALFLIFILFFLMLPVDEKILASMAKKKANGVGNSNLRRGNKKKKFNNLQEYKASEEYQRDKAQSASIQTQEDRDSQERMENIELATKALVSLGFKIKRATDLVSRGIDSGINPKETQMLIKYALSNNNKA